MEDRELIDRAIELLGRVNESVGQAASAFEDGELQEAQDLLDGIDPLGTELDQIAADYGLDACGSAS